MDHQRFDDLTRSLAHGASRRGVLRLLAGSALGGVLGLLGLEEAAAACRLAGQRCDATHRCCAGAKCASNGRCKCKVSQNFFACDGPGTRCVDVGTSETHCGGCGNPSCGSDEICLNGGCVNTCQDGLHNAQETDVDCGGPICARCDDGRMCTNGDDCKSGVCSSGVCQAPSCTDGVQNGGLFVGESDIDCGGEVCPKCANGKTCRSDRDCQTDFCDVDNVCRDPHDCFDGITNGLETDVDCGGQVCPACADGKRCFINGDCQSDFCDRSADPNEAGVCAPLQCDPPCDPGKCEVCGRLNGAALCFNLCPYLNNDGVCVYDGSGRPTNCCPPETTKVCFNDNGPICCIGPSDDFPCCA